MHQKALLTRDARTSTVPIEYEDKQTYFQQFGTDPARNQLSKGTGTLETVIPGISTKSYQSQSPFSRQNAFSTMNMKNRSESIENSTRPIMMPPLHAEESDSLPQARTMLEQAERIAAVEAIDQNSLRFQVKVRKNLEAMHEDDIASREEQWKEKIAKTRTVIEKLKQRNRELEEVMNKYLVNKGIQSEGSKEISRLIELKSRLGDEINQQGFKKAELEQRINELHLELERHTFDFESQERTLMDQLEILKRQITMSENEKLDSVIFNKENLKMKKDELLRKRQELVDKWQNENMDFQQIFERTDKQKFEIRQQLHNLKAEKEMMKKEKEVLMEKEKQVKQEKEVSENNIRTMKLYNSFQDPNQLKNSDLFKEIIRKVADRIVDNTRLADTTETANEYSKYISDIRTLHESRRSHLLKNSSSQIEILSQQLKEEELKRSKSSSKLYALKQYLNK